MTGTPTAGAPPAVTVMPEVTVMIVAHQAGAHLGRCLAALGAQTFTDFEAIVVDNGSTDGAVAALAPLPSWARAVDAGGNLGFAAANNLAARAARGAWLAALNPDAFPEPDWLAVLIDATRRHPGAAMFGSTQIDDADPSRLDGAGDCYHGLGLAWRGGYGHPLSALPPEGTVFAPCAAAALYRRDAFLAAGGFDERFFCYHEDVDLGFRLRLAGHVCVQVAAARVRHVGSATTGRRSAFSVYHGTRNRIWTFMKTMPAPLLWPLLPGFLLLNLALLARAAPQGVAGPTWRGMVDGVRGLRALWPSRRAVQRARRARLGAIARAMTWAPGPALRRAPDVRPVAAAETGGRR